MDFSMQIHYGFLFKDHLPRTRLVKKFERLECDRLQQHGARWSKLCEISYLNLFLLREGSDLVKAQVRD